MKTRLNLTACLVALLMAAGVRAAEPVAARSIADARQLLLDTSLIESYSGKAQPRLGMVIPREVAFRSDQPWEGDAFAISSIYQIDGVYHMLYRGRNTSVTTEGADDSYLCLATSKDGITWEKPALGLVEFQGSKANNIVAYENGHSVPMCFTFYDPRLGVPPNERVKAIDMRDGDRRAGQEGKGLRAQVLGSADGRVWRELPVHADLKSDVVNAFDGGSVSWSEEEQQFVGYFRWWDTQPKANPRLLYDWMIGRPGVRTVFRSVSKDLTSWSQPQPITYGDTPREHIYEACAFHYDRAPGLYVILGARFNPGRRALSLEEERALDITRLKGNKNAPTYTFASDANDIVLLSTKPGSTEFARPFMEAFVRPGTDLGNWGSRSNYPSLSGGLISTGPAEISFYITRNHLQKTNHIQRMSLRTDGFVSINAPYAGGDAVTVPVTFTGDHLELNFSTSGAGEVRVELQDAAGKPLPGFSLEDCDVLIGDRIAGVVSWHGQQSLARYIGKAVRLRFVLVDADVYAFQFPSPGR
ncbi:MAG: hypothetical protein JSS11_08730 [Verrucomicrobia bacterium]|nr:hypothetical protein [Verrucomicrobiota bacterium]